MSVAFKLLCDEAGRITGIELGEPYATDVKEEDIAGAPIQGLTLKVAADPGSRELPVIAINEVELGPNEVRAMRCCLRLIGGRWVCVPC
jgi:hypothetical protein